jgi:hypothetical protein
MTWRSRLRRALPVAGWGAFLVVLAAVALIFRPDSQTIVLGFGSGAAALLAGVTVLRSRRTPQPTVGHPDIRDIPDLSFATVLAAVGVSLAIVGVAIGSWLVGIGGGLALAGFAGLGREVRAERRGRRVARTEELPR